MESTALLHPSRQEVELRIFIATRNSSFSAGFEMANRRSDSKHGNQ
jgi:hypothetical protein